MKPLEKVLSFGDPLAGRVLRNVTPALVSSLARVCSWLYAKERPGLSVTHPSVAVPAPQRPSLETSGTSLRLAAPRSIDPLSFRPARIALRSASSVNPCPAALVLAAYYAAPRFASVTLPGLRGLTAPLCAQTPGLSKEQKMVVISMPPKAQEPNR